MGTHCYIAMENGDGTYRSIYCQLDGYPEGAGKMLIQYYNTSEKLKDLLDLGDLYSLGEKLSPNPTLPHSRDASFQKGVTVAFMRDDLSSGYEARDRTLDEMFGSDDDPAFIYVFTAKGEWEVCPLNDYDPEFVKVSDILSPSEGLGGHTQKPPSGPQMTMS